MRRCAVSIPSNIAEGHGRLNVAESRHFLGISRGSKFELQTQLEIARALKFGQQELLDETEALSHEVGKMIYSIISKLKKSA
jgi:four helix bundle protein